MNARDARLRGGVPGAGGGLLGGAADRAGAPGLRRGRRAHSSGPLRRVPRRRESGGRMERHVVSGRHRVCRALERAGDAPGRRLGRPFWPHWTSPPTAGCSAMRSEPPSRRGSPAGRPHFMATCTTPASSTLARRAFTARFCARRTGRRCSIHATRTHAAAVTTAPRRARRASPRRRRGRRPARVATTSRAACSHARRATDRETRPTRRAIRASFPGTRTAATHAAHVEPSPERSGGVPCSTCHPVPGSPVIGGLHGDGIVEVTFDTTLVPGEPSYDASTGSCAVYCHAQGGAKPSVTWTEPVTPVGCGDCHRSPPAGHFAGPCTGCHAEANATGTALTGGPLHLNGKVDLGDGSGQCGACHGTADSPWPTLGRASRARDADPHRPSGLLELPRCAHRDPRSGPSRWHRARRLLRPRDGKRRSPDLERQRVHERRLPWGKPRGPGRSSGLERPIGRAGPMRRLPRHSAVRAHDVRVLQSLRLPRQRGRARGEWSTARLGERQGAPHRRGNRVGSLSRL